MIISNLTQQLLEKKPMNSMNACNQKFLDYKVKIIASIIMFT